MTTTTVRGLTTTHSYDSTGARTAATTGAGAANTTRYYWDKHGPLAELLSPDPPKFRAAVVV